MPQAEQALRVTESAYQAGTVDFRVAARHGAQHRGDAPPTRRGGGRVSPAPPPTSNAPSAGRCDAAGAAEGEPCAAARVVTLVLLVAVAGGRLSRSARTVDALARRAPSRRPPTRRTRQVPVLDASADRLGPPGDLSDLPDEAAARRRRARRRAGAGAPQRTPLFYRHPMRADVTSPVPAKDEMGMDYIPVYADDAPAPTPQHVAGHAGFTLSTERQQLIGVTRAPRRAPPLDARDPRRRHRRLRSRALPGDHRIPRGARRAARLGDERAAGSAHAAPTPSPAPPRCACASSASPNRSSARSAAAAATRSICCCPGKTAWVYAQVYEYEMDAGAARPAR